MNPELDSSKGNSIEKAERKENPIAAAFGGLTKREQVMIYGLVIVAVVAVLGFFVFIPILNNISSLQEEVSTLEITEMEYQTQINQTPAFQQQYEEAAANLALYTTFFYEEMQPETIDKTITSLVKKVGMRPTSLTLSELEAVSVPLFAPEQLRPSPIPEVVEGEGAEGEGVEGENPEAQPSENSEEQPSEDGEVPPEEGGEMEMFAGGPFSFVYTIDVIADGEQSQLYNLIDTVAKMTSLELMSYNLTPPEEEIINPGDILTGTPTQAASEGSITMQFKIYVHIPGANPAMSVGAAQE